MKKITQIKTTGQLAAFTKNLCENHMASCLATYAPQWTVLTLLGLIPEFETMYNVRWADADSMAGSCSAVPGKKKELFVLTMGYADSTGKALANIRKACPGAAVLFLTEEEEDLDFLPDGIACGVIARPTRTLFG